MWDRKVVAYNFLTGVFGMYQLTHNAKIICRVEDVALSYFSNVYGFVIQMLPNRKKLNFPLETTVCKGLNMVSQIGWEAWEECEQ